MKKRFLIIVFVFILLYSFNTFADGEMKFEESFWYTNGDGKWTFFVRDKNGTMDYLRNVKVGINEKNNCVYTIYYFDKYGHCHTLKEEGYPSIYINQYVGPISNYRKELNKDGYVIYQNNPNLPNIQ